MSGRIHSTTAISVVADDVVGGEALGFVLFGRLQHPQADSTITYGVPLIVTVTRVRWSSAVIVGAGSPAPPSVTGYDRWYVNFFASS